MEFDPRIKGRLRELLEEAKDVSNKSERDWLDLSKTALQFAQKGKNKFAIATGSFEYARSLYYNGEINEAIEILTKVLQYSEETDEFDLLSRAYYEIATCYSIQTKYNSAESFLLSSLNLSSKHDFEKF